MYAFHGIDPKGSFPNNNKQFTCINHNCNRIDPRVESFLKKKENIVHQKKLNIVEARGCKGLYQENPKGFYFYKLH